MYAGAWGGTHQEATEGLMNLYSLQYRFINKSLELKPHFSRKQILIQSANSRGLVIMVKKGRVMEQYKTFRKGEGR